MSAETPRYVSKESGKSTELAEKVAARFDKMQGLKDIIASQNFPQKDSLNWLTNTTAYTVTNKDTKGVLEILKKNLPNGKLDDENFVRIAYAHLFKYTQGLDKHSTDNKIFDINVIEPGDRIFVNKGLVFLLRKPGSKYASFGAPIYPWGTPTMATPPAAPETTPPAAPETTPPAAPETTPPAAPETTPPAAPETTPPAAPETTPPAAPETTPPAAPIDFEADLKALNPKIQLSWTDADFVKGAHTAEDDQVNPFYIDGESIKFYEDNTPDFMNPTVGTILVTSLDQQKLLKALEAKWRNTP